MKFSVVVAGWLVRWYRFVVSGGVVDRFVVLGLWLVVFIDYGCGFTTLGLGFACYGFGFCLCGGDRGLLHLVLIVLMVDWYYSLSTFFFFFWY